MIGRKNTRDSIPALSSRLASDGNAGGGAAAAESIRTNRLFAAPTEPVVSGLPVDHRAEVREINKLRQPNTPILDGPEVLQ